MQSTISSTLSEYTLPWRVCTMFQALFSILLLLHSVLCFCHSQYSPIPPWELINDAGKANHNSFPSGHSDSCSYAWISESAFKFWSLHFLLQRVTWTSYSFYASFPHLQTGFDDRVFVRTKSLNIYIYIYIYINKILYINIYIKYNTHTHTHTYIYIYIYIYIYM